MFVSRYRYLNSFKLEVASLVFDSEDTFIVTHICNLVGVEEY